ncbi:hypothetical protein [Dactylosporangium darangshiense]|uniref:Uncharacterized protein n=1 Tax=Dactylosporangium darangshiense TaxID=579108 RepID=A0ABP8DHE2_9ACTN
MTHEIGTAPPDFAEFYRAEAARVQHAMRAFAGRELGAEATAEGFARMLERWDRLRELGPAQRRAYALPVETEEPTPSDLPSSCAGAWKLTYAGGQFSVGDRGSACPALRRDRLLLMEDVSGNGLIGPGAAKVWPLQDVPDSLTPPFAFRVAGIPATTPGHTYELIHVRAADAGKATAGADAYEFYKHSMTISLTVVA